MAAQQPQTQQLSQTALHIKIIGEASMNEAMAKDSTAVIPIFPLMTRLWKVVNWNRFDIQDYLMRREIKSARFSIRWAGDDKLPEEMQLVSQADIDSGLELMQARGWKDTLVAYCELKKDINKGELKVATSGKGKKSGGGLGERIGEAISLEVLEWAQWEASSDEELSSS
jgi:hypothetical protein